MANDKLEAELQALTGRAAQEGSFPGSYLAEVARSLLQMDADVTPVDQREAAAESYRSLASYVLGVMPEAKALPAALEKRAAKIAALTGPARECLHPAKRQRELRDPRIEGPDAPVVELQCLACGHRAPVDPALPPASDDQLANAVTGAALHSGAEQIRADRADDATIRARVRALTMRSEPPAVQAEAVPEQHWRVTRTQMVFFSTGGAELHEGSIVCWRTHDMQAICEQGVALVPCDPPAIPICDPVITQKLGLQTTTVRGFEMAVNPDEEAALAAAMGDDDLESAAIEAARKGHP